MGLIFHYKKNSNSEFYLGLGSCAGAFTTMEPAVAKWLPMVVYFGVPERAEGRIGVGYKRNFCPIRLQGLDTFKECFQKAQEPVTSAVLKYLSAI